MQCHFITGSFSFVFFFFFLHVWCEETLLKLLSKLCSRSPLLLKRLYLWWIIDEMPQNAWFGSYYKCWIGDGFYLFWQMIHSVLWFLIPWGGFYFPKEVDIHLSESNKMVWDKILVVDQLIDSFMCKIYAEVRDSFPIHFALIRILVFPNLESSILFSV